MQDVLIVLPIYMYWTRQTCFDTAIISLLLGNLYDFQSVNRIQMSDISSFVIKKNSKSTSAFAIMQIFVFR